MTGLRLPPFSPAVYYQHYNSSFVASRDQKLKTQYTLESRTLYSRRCAMATSGPKLQRNEALKPGSMGVWVAELAHAKSSDTPKPLETSK